MATGNQWNVTAPQRQKRGGGRPRAFDAAKRRKAIQLTKKGLSLNGIAKVLRVDRDTLDAEIKRNADFREEMLAADGDGELWCLERWRRCMEGKGTASQLKAIVGYMARKWPDDYALTKKLEAEPGAKTTNIQINGDVRISNPDERRTELLGIIAAASERARAIESSGAIETSADPQSAVPQPPAD